ncbi:MULTISPECIES: glutaredoxin family protein [Moraxella]|uniref:Thioredoxin family protein n=1 Tax=Moraxella lacunata TaxID=477 RepID=A0A1B8PW96_MORLA|nr:MULTISPECIES: glutaredoxin family protein [Moraxella]MBE9578059.1 glutaredoxin family protein [Moraxella sp. K1664]MBE9587605.1 glutaredoxin family protein [Moraxella sp. K1630]MBE9590684.1 glutaredoxin family protein [Moraxella sp. K127]MBE9595803.1 glutaredoxin family protein [Moraxella sp. K2450]MDH9217992.1 glutaredoxin family protein [Moraxella lacunata]
MNNINFIKYLQNLTDDRFALTCLDHNEYRTFHTLLLATFAGSDSQLIHTSNPATDWYLLGTDGCHLCHASHALLTQAQAMNPHMPAIHVLDLAGSEELIDHLGTLIPILITPTHLLCYPFGVMDVIHLLPNHHHKHIK